MKLEDIKNKTKEATDYLVQSLEAGHSEVLTQYLGAMAKFHTYSFGNIMLIARQKPSASNVAGVRSWNSLGRFVRRGEKGILILAPLVGRKVKTVEEITRENGEEKNPQAQLYGFRAVYVFERLSRDLWPSLCVLDRSRRYMYFSIATSTSSLNSSGLAMQEVRKIDLQPSFCHGEGGHRKSTWNVEPPYDVCSGQMCSVRKQYESLSTCAPDSRDCLQLLSAVCTGVPGAGFHRLEG